MQYYTSVDPAPLLDKVAKSREVLHLSLGRIARQQQFDWLLSHNPQDAPSAAIGIHILIMYDRISLEAPSRRSVQTVFPEA